MAHRQQREDCNWGVSLFSLLWAAGTFRDGQGPHALLLLLAPFPTKPSNCIDPNVNINQPGYVHSFSFENIFIGC